MAKQPKPRALIRLFAALVASTTLLANALTASADTAAARRPVGFYDADAVLRAAARTLPETAALDELLASYEAEAAPLQREVDELRAQVSAARESGDADRRTLETQLAHGTIALLIVRAEAREEAAALQEQMRDQLDHRIAAVTSRVASELDLPVVIRTDRFTRVLDEDAIDLTPQIVAAFGRAAIDQPRDEAPSERRRTRLQACAPDEVGSAVD